MEEKILNMEKKECELEGADKSYRELFHRGLHEGKILAISVDPGYDSFKVIINGEFYYRCPSFTMGQPVASGKKGGTRGIMRSGALYVTHDGIEYRVGEIARMSQHDSSSASYDASRRQIEDERRFSADTFKAAFVGVLYTALYQYAGTANRVGFTVSDMTAQAIRGWNLYLAVEIPQQYLETVQDSLGKFLTEGWGDYTVTYIDRRTPVQMTMTPDIREERVVIVSQALASFRSMVYTTYGARISDGDLEYIEKNLLGCLILTSGYHTMEQVQFNSWFEIVDPQEETQHEDISMEQVDRMTLEAIKRDYEGRLEAEYNIIDINNVLNLEGSAPIRYRDETGLYCPVDVASYHRDALAAMYESLKNYIDRRFPKVNIKSVLLTGGTAKELQSLINADETPFFRNFGEVYLLTGRIDDPEKGLVDLGPVASVAFGGYGYLAVEKVAPDIRRRLIGE